ncbi:MAG: energy-coupling factor ABC transporter permease [Spirochaetes bacterium]|nr:energy-coupling factor ABC transporter permease [Spirochaetota bacterium]
MSITVALVIQAILLGDGGISAIGVDCLNIAALHPFSGWPSIASPRGNLPSL